MLIEIWDHNVTGVIDSEIISGVMEVQEGKPGKSITGTKHVLITPCGNFTCTRPVFDKVTEMLYAKHNGDVING